jgi:ASC-1-like (ASCH) protein
MERIYLKEYTKEQYLEEMKRFYTMEEQRDNGVVAIIFEKE